MKIEKSCSNCRYFNAGDDPRFGECFHFSLPFVSTRSSSPPCARWDGEFCEATNISGNSCYWNADIRLSEIVE